MSLPSTRSVTVAMRGNLDYLQPAQRRVAEAILADPAAAVGLSIGDLASAARTSPATVVRLCRALGVDGYPGLKLALASEAGRRDQADVPAGDIAPGDDLAAVVGKIAAADALAVSDTAREIDLAVLELVIDALAAARRVDIYGVGASAIVAADLAQKLLRIGRTCQAFGDTHMALTSAANLTAHDVAFVISHSGATQDTLDSLLVAKDRHATTIALTNAPASPLAQEADHVLLTAARESVFRSGATASRLAQLTVIDCVFVGLAQRTFDASQEALSSTLAAVQRRRHAH